MSKNKMSLRRTIDQLALSVPNAITGFDEYGRALGINADAVQEFTDNLSLTQRALARTQLGNLTENLALLQQQQDALAGSQNGGIIRVDELSGSFRVHNGVIVRINEGYDDRIRGTNEFIDCNSRRNNSYTKQYRVVKQ